MKYFTHSFLIVAVVVILLTAYLLYKGEPLLPVESPPPPLPNYSVKDYQQLEKLYRSFIWAKPGSEKKKAREDLLDFIRMTDLPFIPYNVTRDIVEDQIKNPQENYVRFDFERFVWPGLP